MYAIRSYYEYTQQLGEKIIKGSKNSPRITSYNVCYTKLLRNHKKIKNIIKILNGSTVKRFTMKEMELKRTGNNVFFKRVRSGWIEISYISI